MGIEENKAAARRYVEEAFNGQQFELILEIFTEDFANRYAGPGAPQGSAGFKALVESIFAAFPDARATILHQAAEGDLVVTHATITGTYTGELWGVPPTGEAITWRYIAIDRFVDGRIVERWEIPDRLAIREQMGFTLLHPAE